MEFSEQTGFGGSPKAGNDDISINFTNTMNYVGFLSPYSKESYNLAGQPTPNP